LATFEHGKIEGAIFIADLFKMFSISAITTEKDIHMLRLYNPGTPQCAASIKQSPT